MHEPVILGPQTRHLPHSASASNTEGHFLRRLLQNGSKESSGEKVIWLAIGLVAATALIVAFALPASWR